MQQPTAVEQEEMLRAWEPDGFILVTGMKSRIARRRRQTAVRSRS